jgi:uncharacterized membrane protein YfcA
MNGKTLLFVILAASAVAFAIFWARAERARRNGRLLPNALQTGIGVLTDFLDTLGVGSFAVTTSLYRMTKLVDDAEIPGTLNVGHAIPTFAEAFIFIAVVDVDLTTLVTMIAAAVLGAWLGAGVVTRWSRRRIQIGMGSLLLVAALIIVLRQTGEVPHGGEAVGLDGPLLVAGLAGNFVLGALMTLGIGLYAPCMILVSLLGMNARTAFPIMMGSCAFLMPAASIRFVRSGRYDRRAAIGLTLGGTPAVLVAGLIVRELPLAAVQWLVVVVVVLTAASMLRTAAAERV